MTISELIGYLAGIPAETKVAMSVDCPRGGNSLPCEFNTMFRGDEGVIISLTPVDGVEYEVYDAEDEDEDEDEDEGPTVVIEYPSIGRTYANNEYGVYEYSVHGEDSVLAGEERRVFLDCFKTLAEAQAKYPDAEFHGEGEDVTNEV